MGELRKTNYGVWVYDDGTLNENEKALFYIKESAESVGDISRCLHSRGTKTHKGYHFERVVM